MLRITIIDTTGLVRYDSSFDGDSTLENHLYRPEILQLSEQSVGKDIRLSQSLGEEYYYLSQQFPGVYIRSSLPYNMSVTASLKANLFFIYIMAALLLVVMLVLYIISKRFSINLKESEDKLKRELTQNISHELKTPVSSILGYMESVLDNPDLPAERLHFLYRKSTLLNSSHIQKSRIPSSA